MELLLSMPDFREKTFKLRRESLESAFQLIQHHHSPKVRSRHRDNVKLIDACNHTPLIANSRRHSYEASLTNVQKLLHQLRIAIGRHDWKAAATFIDFMLNLNGKLLPIIWKTMFLVIMNHPDSDEAKLNTFLQFLGVRSTVEKVTFLKEQMNVPVDLDVFLKNRTRLRKINKREVEEESDF